MANQPIQQNFTKGLNKDLTNFLLDPSQWSHARNLINNSSQGDLLTLSTEPATKLCVSFPYTLIGAIPLDGAEWMVFCTDNDNPDPNVSGNSEIGILNTDLCSYTKFSNTACLNFSTTNLITGASRRNYDCGFNVYWSDGARNPDRYVNTNTTDVNNNIWIQTCTTTSTCTTCVNTDILNCDNIRIAPLMTIPCIKLAKSTTAGTLLNGTYQVAIAYAVNGIKVTDYVILSTPISIFSHTNQAGALTCNITGADRVHFKEMIITLISFVNNQLVAKRLGIFDTDQETIPITNIDQTLPTEDLSNIPLQSVLIEKSDSIWEVNNYLLRNGIYEKPDFNYQPLANQISSNWVLVEYNDDYYHKGGNSFGMNVSYLRDEVYCYFIRWIYNTGDKSASYHIPGRGANAGDSLWALDNTAGITSLTTSSFEGGTIVGTGYMAYWESTEQYPDHQANVWNSNVAGHPEWDLCGKKIRHHKFPDQTISPLLTHFTANKTIRVLGVQFNNIKPPIDNNGNIITNIVGYEILRGSREGNKSIVAKGMINNMRGYPAQPGGTVSGIYQNYAYNDLYPDRYLTTSKTIGTVGGNLDLWQGNELTDVKRDIMSFHSPDTVFSSPFLGLGNLRLYQTLIGTSTGYFDYPYKHPKFKILTKADSVIATITATISILSEAINTITGGATDMSFVGTPDLPYYTPLGASAFIDGPVGSIGSIQYAALLAAQIASVFILLPLKLRIIQQQVLNVITGLIPAKQYAVQYNSTGFYNNFTQTNLTTPILNYQYVKGYLQTFEGFEINNLFRNNYVVLKTEAQLPIPVLPNGFPEISRFTLGQLATGTGFGPFVGSPPLKSPVSPLPEGEPNLCSFYAGYKINIPSQYGQIGTVRQLPISSCIYTINLASLIPFKSPVLFGGDTYINRYTEKNPFLYFNDWLVDVPSDFQYDYTSYENVPYPRYWINNSKIYYDFWSSADKNYHLDEFGNGPFLSFYVHDGFFYLFNNGVRDFYVESDVNVGYRDWGEELTQRFYDPYGYTDIAYMFRSDMIKTDSYYKYDYSLSVSKFYSQYVSFGQVLPRDYNPDLAYTCYDYFPRRMAYSLPQAEELKVDNWRQFLTNNYYDFPTLVRAVKSISNTGALFMLDEQSPVQFTGVQVLQQGEEGKTAITIGDGGLFNQPLQSVVNVDKNLSYGSCKSRYSVINTVHGLVWISQKAGKIFKYSGQLEELSSQGMRYWFAKYLPSRLIEQFPDYPYQDNSVIGVGVQVSYDETYEILYISKKDYKAKEVATGVMYDSEVGFYTVGNYCPPGYRLSTDGSMCESLLAPGESVPVSGVKLPVDFTDPNYFEDCSWTVSYDLKNKYWISFHDWNPDFIVNTRNHHSTTKGINLWVHNNRTDLFANYYGEDYPTEVGFQINTHGNVETLRNIEYYLESYQYKNNGVDRNQIFDFNWDKAIVYNNEQISGILNLTAKSNPYTDLIYPIINPNSIDILYSMKEHKYRFNAFWDITNDRQNLTNMWITSENGFNFQINPLYVNYTKSLLQAKKFRNYNTSVFLKKLVSNDIQMNMRFNLSKELNSPR